MDYLNVVAKKRQLKNHRSFPAMKIHAQTSAYCTFKYDTNMLSLIL